MDLLKILRKRWKITASLFVLSLIATIGALLELPWSYVAQANVLLLPSVSMAKTVGGNRYLAFSYTLTQTANVIELETTDAKTASALAAQGYTAGYTVGLAPSATAPVLLVSVTGGNKATVENTLQGVVQQIGTELQSDQASVTPDNRITDQLLAMSQVPSRQTSKKARPLVGVFAGGIVLTIGIPAIIDAVSVRRGSRRRQQGTDKGQSNGAATSQMPDRAERMPDMGDRGPQSRPAHHLPETRLGPPTRSDSYGEDYPSTNHGYTEEPSYRNRGGY
jgi:hypothetical protein